MQLTRHLVALMSLALLIGCGSTPRTPTEPLPSNPTPPTPPAPPVSARSSVGCFSAVDANTPTMCGLVTSLGSPQADFELSGEVNIERAFWSGIPVRAVSVMNDCDVTSRNARADPITRDIYYGYYMYNSLVSQFGTSLPAAGVLAHEWGHQVQFNFQWISNPVRPMELEADAFSGYYMALNKGWAWSYMTSYFQAVYTFGDTNFSSPGHHGTPEERLSMARVGFDTATQAAILGRPFGYFELHQIFYQSISRLGLAIAPVQITEPVLLAVADRVATGQASDILAGRGSGSDGRVPGSDVERQRLWPKR